SASPGSRPSANCAPRASKSRACRLRTSPSSPKRCLRFGRICSNELSARRERISQLRPSVVQDLEVLHNSPTPVKHALQLCRYQVQLQAWREGNDRRLRSGEHRWAVLGNPRGSAKGGWGKSHIRTDRKALAKAIATLGAGDVLMVTKLDRLARSTRDLLNTLA